LNFHVTKPGDGSSIITRLASGSERRMTTLQVFMQMHSNTLGHKYFPTAYNHIDNFYK